MNDFDYEAAWRVWQEMDVEDYEAAVLAATLREIDYWVVGQPNEYGRMIARVPRLAGAHPSTEIVVDMWDDNVGTYERRYKVWRDDRPDQPDSVPPPGIRLSPQFLARGIAQDLHS